MTRLACLLLLVACSSRDPQQTTDSGVPKDDAATDASSKTDASDASNVVTDSGSDASLDPFVPHAPAGATQCGSGVISAASAQTACTEPSWILDDAPQIDGGMGAMARSCSALTIGAGEWQIWCSPGSVYVWARIPITNANVLQDCHGTSLLMIDYGYYQSGNGGGNLPTATTYETNGTEIAGTPPNDPQVIVTWLTFSTGPQQTSGTVSAWVAGSIEDTCNSGAFGPPTVLTGFDAKWQE